MDTSIRASRASSRITKCLIALALILASGHPVLTLQQKKADVRKSDANAPRKTESGAEVRSGLNNIPDATEPCTPQECDWWKRIRNAGNEVMKKNGKGSEQAKTTFYILLLEGQQKSYRVPLKDRPHQLLAFGNEPIPHDQALRMHLSGTYVFSIEFKADASIGDVRMVTGANSLAKENLVKSTKEYVFLPAVKDGSFVTEFGEVKLSFFDKWNQKSKDAENNR